MTATATATAAAAESSASTLRLGGPPRFAHQRQALRRAIETKGSTALLMDAGTGKTGVALDYASLLAAKAPSGEARVLVVAPLVAVDTWVDQAATFVSPDVSLWAEALGGSRKGKADALRSRGPQGVPVVRGRGGRTLGLRSSMALNVRATEESGCGVDAAAGPDGLPGPRLVLEVVNVDTFASRESVSASRTVADVLLEAVLAFEPDLVVIDESHRIKGPSSNTSRFFARLAERVPRRMILTGTVTPLSPLDVYAQWRWLDPFAFGYDRSDGSRTKATLGSFRGRFAQMGGWQGKQVIGFRNLDDMQRIMADRAVVVRKEDALDLPPTTDVEVHVHLSPAERAAYDQMTADLVADFGSGDTASAPSRLTQMLRLRQITAGHLPDDGGVAHTLGDSKARAIEGIVHDNLAGERRVVVFAMFTAEIEALRTVLARSGTRVEVITGATSPAERRAIRQRFAADGPERIVLIAQIKTMSLAVNELVTASHAVFASLSQQRDDLIQAKARLDRQGQTRPVTFWHALVPDSVDQVILRSHQHRTDLENALLAHVRSHHEQGQPAAAVRKGETA